MSTIAKDSRARRRGHGINLRRPLRVGAWNVLSLSEDNRLLHLSGEVRRLGVEVAALSQTRRPGTGEISSGGYTYYWSGSANGAHL